MKIARFVELELEYEGYLVEKAFDGREGLELALAQPFDLILLDIMLPGLSGVEVLRRLRRTSSTPVILLTARDEVADKVAGLDAGADKQLIKQVVRILVDNSIKFTPEGEKIFLKVFKKEDSVHILIQDSGIGIAAEDLAKIFDRFFRSDPSRARKTGGAGLGLSIAKWIVERHGAYFELLSRVDFGTRVTIILPSFEENIKENLEI